MPIGYLFWMVALLWFLFGLWGTWPASNDPRGYYPIGGNLLLFILLQTFGSIVK
jgi:hypothetical protein